MRLFASDPEWAAVDDAQRELARLLNPACWFGDAPAPAVEGAVARAELEGRLADLLAGSAFRGFIDELVI